MRDDDALIGEIQQGSTAAFEELYSHYRARAWHVALSACGDERRAAEAVEQAFVSIWRSSGSYRAAEHATVAAWLLTAVRNQAVSSMRAQADGDSSLARKILSSPRAFLSGRARARTLDRTRVLRVFLDQIPDSQQEVIALALFGELSLDEIATCLGLSRETIKSHMRLGLHKLAADRKQTAPDAFHEQAAAGQSAQTLARPHRRHPLGRRLSPPPQPSETARSTP